MESAKPSDDAGVPDEADLWRRVPPDKKEFDKNSGCLRPSSLAFTDQRESPMSVTVAGLYLESGKTVDDYFSRFEEQGYGLASVNYGLAKELGLRLDLRPTEDDAGHALLVGSKPRSVRRKLARRAKWVVKPRTK